MFYGPTETSSVETGAHGIEKAEGPGLAQRFRMRKFKTTYEMGYCNEGCRKDCIKPFSECTATGQRQQTGE